ncbi:S8 family serine peptidase [Flammeovirgaceae bacterium SG7u.111]|nr:S8 family serine peptidase [Flammeovirgaceae bacterium SG7u.132]WPO33936.1 S8 family serine peptidase [Flammeovirgaceae bacterium SG7u.111]
MKETKLPILVIFITLTYLSNVFAQTGGKGKLFVPKKTEVVIKLRDNQYNTNSSYNLQLQSFSNDVRLQAKLRKKGMSASTVFKGRAKQQKLGILAAPLKQNTPKHKLENYYKIEVPEDQLPSLLAELAEEDWVEYAEALPSYDLLYTPTDEPHVAYHWGHVKTQVYDAWDITQGDTNTVIGIIDTGVQYTHPSLKNQIHYNNAERYGLPGIDDDSNGFVDDSLGFDFGDLDNDPYDTYSHGTEVAGVAAAEINDNFGSFGVGFKSKIMPIKILRSDGALINLWAAAVYAAENGCKVINMSLGRPGGGASTFEQEVIDYITKDLDVVIVAAAGNTNAYIDFYPASYDNVISVAHSNQTDSRVATYSYFVDMLAPGYQIPAARYNSSANTYIEAVGSSYASPFVAGAAALIRSHFPDLTAIQVGELLRQTTDDVYNVAGNNLPDMLGTGRLNVYRALTERYNTPAIRMTQLFDGKSGEEIFKMGDTVNAVLGDTMQIWGKFQNLLGVSSSDLKITLTSQSPYLTIVDSVMDAGTIATLDFANNQTAPFKAYVHPDMPIYHKMLFKLSYSDGSYSDYQYFYLYRDGYFNVKINNIALSTSPEGRVGNIGTPNNPKGIGFNWNDNLLMNESGLLLATPDGRVSDALISEPGQRNYDFIPQLSDSIASYGQVYKEIVSRFTDVGAVADPINIQITQHLKGWEENGSENFIILEFNIENKGTEVLDTLFVGHYSDWDLPSNPNFADWDSLYQFGYVYNSSNEYAGVKILKQTTSHFTFDKVTDTPNNLRLGDGFSDEEKLLAASGGFPKNKAGYHSGGEDVSHMLATSIYNLQPGELDTIQIAIAVGTSKEELQSSFLMAAEKISSDIFLSEKPVITDTLFCEGDSLIISPTNGTNFKFYADANLDTLLYTGTEMGINVSDTAKLFYVTNADNALESEEQSVSLQYLTISAAFTLPDTIDLEVSPVANFDASLSENITDWEWDFGDNSQLSGNESSSHTYSEVGVYDVKLVYQNSLGCEDSIIHTLVATKGYFTPIESDSLICEGKTLEITPQNGSSFDFYLGSKPDSLIHSGATLEWTNYSGKHEIHAIATDTALAFYHQQFNVESQAASVSFTSADTVHSYTPTMVQFEGLSTNYLTAIWDFGDGNIGTDTLSIAHNYAQEGTYTVRLTIIDNLGCQAFDEKEIVVRHISPTPTVAEDTIWVCSGESAIITPSNGTNFRFYQSDSTTVIEEATASLSMENISTNQTIWISSLDSALESEKVAVQIQVEKLVASISAPDTVLLHENNSASFEITGSSIGSVKWTMDGKSIGEGTSINYDFQAEGTYLLKAEVDGEQVCNIDLEKTIITLRKSPTPTVAEDTIWVCSGGSATIDPGNGTNFRFYQEDASSILIKGTGLTLDNLAKSHTVWVSSLDSALESEKVAVSIQVEGLTASISAPDTVLLHENNSASFEITGSSIGSIKWTMDGKSIGEGTSINYNFQAEGTYLLKAEVDGKHVCNTVLEQEIVAVLILEKPETTQDTLVASNATVIISPSGGTIYNFYLADNPDSLIHSGETLVLDNLVKTTTILISQVQFGQESEKTSTTITVAPPVIAYFDMSNDTLDIYLADSIVFTTQNQGTLTWDFGNGEKGDQAEHTVSYEVTGEYEITLVVTDSLGTSDTTKQTLAVIDTRPLAVEDELELFSFNMYPNPATSKVNLLFSQVLKSRSLVQVYSLSGKVVFQKEVKPSLDDELQLDLPQLDAGMYMLKLETGKKRFVKKLMIN